MAENFYFDPVLNYIETQPGGIVLHNYVPLPILDKSETLTVSPPEELQGEGVSAESERYMQRSKKPFKDLQTMLSKDTSKKYISFGKL